MWFRVFGRKDVLNSMNTDNKSYGEQGKEKNLAKKKYFSFNIYGQSHGGDKGRLLSSWWINRTLKGNLNSKTREFTLGAGSRYDFH